MEVLAYLGILTFLVIWAVLGERKGRADLQRAMESEGLVLVAATRRWLFSGRLFGGRWHGRAQRIYDVVVHDRDGQQHTGVARVGGWFLGVLSDQVDVRWDS